MSRAPVPNSGRNYILKGKFKYKSTPAYYLTNAKSLMGGALEVAFAKANAGGLMLLSTNASFEERIAGTVVIYLVDGSIITCLDKGIKDRIDGESRALYNLTTSEINQLSQTNISSIRYKLKYPSGRLESLSVSNESDAYGDVGSPKFDIPSDITLLYK